jgi:hypothetical protein
MKNIALLLALSALVGCTDGSTVEGSAPAGTGGTPSEAPKAPANESPAGESALEKAAASASESVGGAGSALGGLASNLGGQAGSALDALKGIELPSLDGLSGEQLMTKGGEAVKAIAAQLGSVNDLPGAEAVTKAIEPWLERLGSLKESLGGVLPEGATLQGAIDAVKARLDPNGEVMKVLEPVLAKLQGLLG